MFFLCLQVLIFKCRALAKTFSISLASVLFSSGKIATVSLAAILTDSQHAIWRHGLQSKVNSIIEYFASINWHLDGEDLNMHTQSRTHLKGFMVCKTPEGKTKRSICSRHWSSWKEQTIRMSSATFPETISSRLQTAWRVFICLVKELYCLHWAQVVAASLKINRLFCGVCLRPWSTA